MVSGDEDILLINSQGVIIRMSCADVNIYSRTAQGVKLMNLDEGVKVISLARTEHEEPEEELEEGTGDEAGTQAPAEEPEQ